MPKSTMELITWVIAVRIRLLPPLPITIATASFFNSNEGDIMDETR